jgi:capsular exopolysaccharide synthesis family protein
MTAPAYSGLPRESSLSERDFAEVRRREPPVVEDLANLRSIALPAHEENCLLRAPLNPHQQALVEAYHQLRTRLAQNHDLSTLVVSESGAGEGRTLTALNLALCFANTQDVRVLLVDADLRSQSLSQMLGLQGPGLGEILEKGHAIEEALVCTDTANLFVVPAGTISGAPPEILSGSEWRKFVTWSEGQFKLVLIDAPPVLRFADFDLIASACRHVVLAACERKTNRTSLADACAHVNAKKFLGVIYANRESL